MYLTVHSSIGAAIGASTGNPILAYVFGFFSHLLLDAIPHAEPDQVFNRAFKNSPRSKKNQVLFLLIVAIDSLAWIFFAYFLISKTAHSSLPMLMGMFGSVSPDYMFGLGIVTKNKLLLKFDALHTKNHFDIPKHRPGIIKGNLTQLLMFALGLSILGIF